MKNMKMNKSTCVFYAAILSAFLLLTGCSSLRGSAENSTGSQGTAPGGTGGALYHKFSDVLIPGELTEVKKGSYVIESNGFAAGVVSFKGRVEIGSLIAFFRENMVKDGWRPIASFTASRTILLFQKANRWCVINITDGDFSVGVEVGVVPTTNESPDGIIR